MSIPFAIQGQLLEVTVVCCNKLKDTEWISRQDPYVCLEYASTKFRTRTCTDGGKNPTFQEKFMFTMIEGLRELNLMVWNSNTVGHDDFIGSGKVQLQKVLSQGYDDSPWPIQTRNGRHAGEVRLILHYANAKKPATNYGSSTPQNVAQPLPHASYYSPPPPASASYPLPTTAYPAPSYYPSYPHDSTAYPYPPPHSATHPQSYPPPSAYPPQPYPPPSAYPPQPYPHPPQASPYYPPGSRPGTYPPPPY